MPPSFSTLASAPRLVVIAAFAHVGPDGEVRAEHDVFPVIGIASDLGRYEALVVADDGIFPARSFEGPGRAVGVFPHRWGHGGDTARVAKIAERLEAEAVRSHKEHEARNGRKAPRRPPELTPPVPPEADAR